MIAVIVIGLLVAVALAVEKHKFGYSWKSLFTIEDRDGNER